MNMSDLNKLRCIVRTKQELIRQVYVQKINEFAVNSNNASDNLEEHINAYCYASELSGMIKAYEEVLDQIRLLILGEE